MTAATISLLAYHASIKGGFKYADFSAAGNGPWAACYVPIDLNGNTAVFNSDGSSNVALLAGTNHIGDTGIYVFNAPVVAATVNFATPYTAGDIMGGLLTFPVSRIADEGVIIEAVQIAFKVAVNPSLRLILFNANPSNTTQTDNAAYSLAAADVFKIILPLQINNLGGFLTTHGTPYTFTLGSLGLPIKPAAGTVNIFGLLIDDTGVTLTSATDCQVMLLGRGA